MRRAVGRVHRQPERSLSGHRNQAPDPSRLSSGPTSRAPRRVAQFVLACPASFYDTESSEENQGKLDRNGRKGSLVMEPTERWTPQVASDFYDVASWGKGYFAVGDNGHVVVHPDKDPARAIDLKELVDTLVLRGINLPILIRFADILKHRLGELHGAFQTAIAEHRFQGGYCCVYPIKVNQQRQVVEEVLEFGRPFRFGLEAGSKPELMAVMALADNDTPIICNGFKDDEYIEM